MHSLVKHLRLTHLRIVLHCTVFEVAQDAFRGNLIDSACDASTVSVDLNAIAAGCINSGTMPTLEYLSLVACGCAHALRMNQDGEWYSETQAPRYQWLSWKAWRVVYGRDREPHDPGSNERSSALEELGVEEAEKVMDREDFRLSPREEVGVLCPCRWLKLTQRRIEHGVAELLEDFDCVGVRVVLT